MSRQDTTASTARLHADPKSLAHGTRRLRVVQVGLHAHVGRRNGAGVLEEWPRLAAVAGAAARAGVDVTVIIAAHKSEIVERHGVEFRFINDPRAQPRRLWGTVPVVRRPSRLIANVVALAPDVVHVQGLVYPIAIGQLARALRGTPVLVQDHGTSVPTGWRRYPWRWMSQSIAAVSFTAREQAAPFFSARAFCGDLPVFEVMEGSTTFQPGDRDAARRATAMFGDPCILWTGHLNANKDPLTALAAFETAAAQLPDARLWCCFGEAPLLEVVQSRIASSAILRDRVVLLGRREHAEMEQRFRAADFFIQMSNREAGGLSPLEALACGTTPLVSDIPSFRRIVGDAGALIPVGNVRGLAEAMVQWSKRNPLELRRAARARFERELTFEAMGHDLRAVYESLARRS